MGFQKQVYTQPAPAVAGDFASANPRSSVLAGPGGLIAGSAGLVVGRFAWLSYATTDANDAPATANNFGSGPIAGFVHREQQGLITQYLSESSMTIPQGFEVTLMSSGDYWVVNDGAVLAQIGMKAYASYADGRVSFAATGAPGVASGSASSIAAATGSFTASIADNIMTVTAVLSGVAVGGGTLSGTGVASGTQIVQQVLPLTGGEALGGIGRYVVSIPEQTVASTTISETYGVLTVGGTVAGSFTVGSTLSGTNVVAGTTVMSQLTGTPGGAGTYVVNNNTVVASTAITAGVTVETKYVCRSAGLPGELVKISSNPYG